MSGIVLFVASIEGVCRMAVGKHMGSRVGALTVLATLAIAGFVAPFALKAAPADTPGAVTFAKDIAPILQRSCQNCHRPDGVAPMSLVTYDEVRPYARSIKTRTAIGPHAGVMPPWYMEKNI